MDKYFVVDMQDGGMGSIRFLSADTHKQRLGRMIAQADYVDVDGVTVSITLRVAQDGEPFELDFWKVDFSLLIRYPEPSELRISHDPNR